MTCLFSAAAEAKSVGTNAILAIGAVALVVVCATGVAAFAGLLPESDGVASTVTAIPIIDVQVDGRRSEPDSPIEPQRKNADSETAVN